MKVNIPISDFIDDKVRNVSVFMMFYSNYRLSIRTSKLKINSCGSRIMLFLNTWMSGKGIHRLI